MKKYISLILSILICGLVSAQIEKKDYNIVCIGFYNFENLFDTINDPTNDESFLPTGEYLYTSKVYFDKLSKLAEVLQQLGTEHSPDGLAFIGTAEIEHQHCLEDLVAHPAIASRNYKVIQYESPDERGIDCALLYNPKYFNPILHYPIFVDLSQPDDTSHNTTRDILYIKGTLMQEEVHVLVNHWPSRRGGEEATAALRDKAAGICKKLIDSLLAVDPDSKVFLMGDFNDDPVSNSIKNILNAKSKINEVKKGELFNPFFELYKKGLGTMAYRDAWGLFDQIIISSSITDKNQPGLFFKQAIVFNKDFLITKTGQWKGYPYRTFSGAEYMGGYSDHFATYLVLLKEKK